LGGDTVSKEKAREFLRRLKALEEELGVQIDEPDDLDNLMRVNVGDESYKVCEDYELWDDYRERTPPAKFNGEVVDLSKQIFLLEPQDTPFLRQFENAVKSTPSPMESLSRLFLYGEPLPRKE
jgi:hypothetical protein